MLIETIKKQLSNTGYKVDSFTFRIEKDHIIARFNKSTQDAYLTLSPFVLKTLSALDPIGSFKIIDGTFEVWF